MSRAIQFAFLFLFAALSAAFAQERQVYAPALDLGENSTADLRLIEESAAAKSKGMTLDLCFARNVDSSNGVLILGDYDRVVIALKAEANSLTGAGSSNEAKRPVEVKLQRRPDTAGKVRFSGTVSIDGKAYQVSPEPVFGTDPSAETEYVTINAKPEAFDETAAPNTLGIKFKAGSLPQLLEVLRPANVRIDLTSGAVDKCAILRSGTQYLRVVTAPERSQALVAELKKLFFVVDAGWTSAIFASPSVRISGARWVKQGTLEREQAANALSAAMAKYLGASVVGSEWDSRSGELKVTFKRPSKLFPGLGLADTLQMTALIAPERLGETDRAVLWGPTISGDIADEATGTRLSFVPLTLFAGPPEGIVISVEPEVLARLLDAEWWDSANNAWTKR